MRGIKIALATTAVTVSIVGSAYAAEACGTGSGDPSSHHHGDPGAYASGTAAPQDHAVAFHHYRWTHHQYRHHHQRHYGWWKGWHAGWFWHHGKPVRHHPTPTPTPTPTPSPTEVATPSAAPSAS